SLARCFIEVELGVALLGGLSAPVLFISFPRIGDWFSVLLYGIVFGVGTLVGLELPLLMRLLKEHLDFKELVSRVLTFDYIGALVGSLMFPILFLPKMGLIRTSLLFGMMNALVGLWGTWLLKPLLVRGGLGLRIRSVLVLLLLLTGFLFADKLTTLAEEKLYPNSVVYATQSPYQRIVVTSGGDKHFQLWLNGKLQFDSRDEYRYHEALVHPAMQATPQRQSVLVLGGGDGLGLREILKYPEVTSVTLVDLDPEMTALSRNFPPLAELNSRAFDDDRVTVVNQDAMIWLEDVEELFDVVIIDFPDPNNFALGKLYSRRFYRMLKQRLAPEGAIAIQSASPLFARKAFWCIQHTLEAAGFTTRPYQVAVPSFGLWGFGLVKHQPFSLPTTLPDNLSCKYLTADLLPTLFVLPVDVQPVETEINRLDNQILVRYYERY
ncbi:MAG: polyamine aminopropyltransferase, partial [Planctomycetaceae bacterium]|nr:polyamine aminopropyltransferase [Planctomycetaceae bacterium]